MVIFKMIIGSRWHNVYFDVDENKIMIVESYVHIENMSDIRSFSKFICKKLRISYRELRYKQIKKSEDKRI